MPAGAVLVLVILLGIGLPVALWYLIEAETESTVVTDRETAEREAQEQYRRQRGRSAGEPDDGDQ